MTTAVKRPLIRRVNVELRWHASVREMPHVDGFSIPVFEWSFGHEDGLRGGELRAWPQHGQLVFTDRRGSRDWEFTELEEALAKIDEYGWGEPPQIDEVFQATINTHDQLPAKSTEAARRLFDELRYKWISLVVSDS